MPIKSYRSATEMSFNLSIDKPLLLGMKVGVLNLKIRDLEAGAELLVRAECSTLVVEPSEGIRRTATQSRPMKVDFLLAAKESKRERHQLELTLGTDGQSTSSTLQVEQISLKSLDMWETILLVLAELLRRPRRVLIALAFPILLGLTVFLYHHWPAPETAAVTAAVQVNVTVKGKPQNNIKTYLKEFPGNAVLTDSAGEARILVKPDELEPFEWVCASYPPGSEPTCNLGPPDQPFRFQFP